jgi:hypothetical protein
MALEESREGEATEERTLWSELFAASKYRRDHPRAAPSMNDSKNPQWISVGHIGNQVLANGTKRKGREVN